MWCREKEKKTTRLVKTLQGVETGKKGEVNLSPEGQCQTGREHQQQGKSGPATGSRGAWVLGRVLIRDCEHVDVARARLLTETTVAT